MSGTLVPNLLTGFRLAASPALVVLAALGSRQGYWWLLGVAFATDAVDGYVARKLGATSENGARLDSQADLLLWIAVAPSAWWLWPERLGPELPYLLLAFGSYGVALGAGLLKYRRPPSFHAWSGKVVAVAMSGGLLLLLGPGDPWAFRAAALLQVVSAIEETAMVVVLPEPSTNVPTLWHALRLARALRGGSSAR